MTSAIMMDLNSTDQPSGYAADSTLQYGDNGDPFGVPGVSVGNSGGDESDTTMQWNPNGDGNAFDTGWVNVSIIAKVGAGSNSVQAIVAGSGNGSITGAASLGNIGGVEITVGVQNNAAMETRNVSVVFYDGSTIAEQYTSSTGPSVDTTDSSDPVAQEDLFVTPSAGTYTEAIISYQVRVIVPSGVYPDVDDLFSGVYIFD